MTYKDAIVFVVGGGNYMEYTNMKERLLDKVCIFVMYYHEQRTSSLSTPTSASDKGRNILYGTTDMVTPEQLVSQLKSLGDEVM